MKASAAESRDWQVVCEFMVTNQFNDVQELRAAGHPCKWPGASNCNGVELKLVYELARGKRK